MNSKKAIRLRLNKAREGLFPTKTCPASRHVHLIVEGLLASRDPLARALHGFDPEHLASSIASVLEGLWNARRWMKYVPTDPADLTKGGKWVPDLAEIARLREAHHV